MNGIPHRYLTERWPGIGGSIKQEVEDFRVTEVPLYHPADQGEHTFFEIRKQDISTLDAVDRIARALEVHPKEVGYAGLKDRRAITRQVLSVRLVPPARVRALRLPNVDVLWARLHGNKLRIGHLQGNRFRIRVRGVRRGARDSAARIIERVLERGLPNYYGPQRFGSRGDAFLIGESMLEHRHRETVYRILGYPSALDNNQAVLHARRSFMAGDLREASESFPRHYRDERRLLKYLLRAPTNYRGAVRRISENVRKIYCSAYQSFLFNRILDRRLELSGGAPGLLFAGDLAQLQRNGAVFQVRDTVAEQPRASRFEISPTGPLFGKLMPQPEGLEYDLEQEALRERGIRGTIFNQLMPNLHMRGGRRPFCVPVRDLRWELHERDLFLEFFLPKGSYATTFLREIIKEDTPPPVYYGQDAGSATPAAPAGGDSEAGAEPADDDPEDV